MEKLSKLITSKYFLRSLTIIVVIVTGVTSLYFYSQYQNSKQLLNNSNQTVNQQTEELKKKVGNLIELPVGEEPTIATVSDVTKLKGQAFFANAKNGDKVLIYQKAKEAILYRPSINKLILAAAYNPAQSPQTSQAIPSATPTPAIAVKTYKVVIYNGTLILGFAASTQKDLASKTTKFQVIDTGDAAKSGYTQTLVVDATGSNKSAAAELAGLVSGKVGELPSGEKLPTGTDFLVILGSNK